MANPQPDKFIRISNELYEAIMQSDFSKRQRNIIDFVMRMSYGCHKKYAILRPSDFELAGVGRNHIKSELQNLMKANVLIVDGELYRMNKNYDQWRVSLVKSFNQDKFNQVLKRNLDAAAVPETGIEVPETGTEVPKTGTGFTDAIVPETGITVPETGTVAEEEFLKQELESSQNRNSRVPKTGIGTPDEPFTGAGFQAPKDIIKDNLKIYSTTTTTTTKDGEENREFDFGNVFKAYERNFIAGGKITQFDIDEFSILFDDFGGEWLLQAMREAYRQGPDKRNFAYVHAVLKGYKERGGPGQNNHAVTKGASKTHDSSARSSHRASGENQRTSEYAHLDKPGWHPE